MSNRPNLLIMQRRSNLVHSIMKQEAQEGLIKLRGFYVSLSSDIVNDRNDPIITYLREVNARIIHMKFHKNPTVDS